VGAADQEGSERGAFLDALEVLLKPLMPLALRYDVSPGDVGQVLKTLYVETLAVRLQEQGRPASAARLALLAGLPRSEVDALFARQAERHLQRNRDTKKLDELSGLLATWHDDSRFATPYGAPLDLSLQPERNFKTFSELIDVGAKGSDANLVLDELLAAGCLEVHANKFVRCISRTYVPSGIDVSRIARMGRYVGALSANFSHNLLRAPDESPYFERVLSTNEPVTAEFRERVLRHLNTTALPFLEQLDRWLEADEGNSRDPRGMRCGVCMFFFEEPIAGISSEGKAFAAAS
jgi:hypothetical protein